MRLATAFRLSSYLTLALACACLGYAEMPFLPATPYMLVSWGAFLLLAFFLEGRWALSARAANLLGLIIAGLTVYWVINLYLLAESGQDWNGIPWPAVLLPHAGPLLMLLLLAKLFRPKRVADHWWLQTIGFLHVALACVLAAEPFFGFLLLAYTTSALWCLTLLQMYGAGEKGAAAPAHADATPHQSTPENRKSKIPFLGLRQAARWALVVGTLGVVLFLAIPRQSALLWDPLSLSSPGRRNLVTGFDTELDMGVSGSVQVSEEVAFEVTVVDARGRPKEDLPDDQRWRGGTLSLYDTGRWLPRITVQLYDETLQDNGTGETPPRGHGFAPLPLAVHRHTHTNDRLPELGGEQYFLTYTLDRRRAGGFFLAEPVILGPGATEHPYVCLRGPDLVYRRQLFYEMDGTLSGLSRPRRGRFSYVQVTRPAPAGQADLATPRWLLYPDGYYINFNQYPLPNLRGWGRALLNRLAAQGRYGLTPANLTPPEVQAPLAPRNHEAVARALAQFFATSGEYTYSLNLRSSRKQGDPTLAFLMDVKEGHCDRFAGSLALLLRSLGVPTRVVTGFRGAEHQGDGHYVVRQSHAHSWVEALVPIARLGGQKLWLTLDPTPATAKSEAAGFDWRRFWTETMTQLQALWRSFVVDFDPDRQREALLGLWALLAPGDAGSSFWAWIAYSYSGRFWTKPGFWVLTVPALGVLGLVLRRLGRWRGVRRRKNSTRVAGFYGRLLRILERRCRLRPRPSQTPRELAETARQLLRQTPELAGQADQAGPGDLAHIPVQVAALFYGVRFGGRALAHDELREIERRLQELDSALAKARIAWTGQGAAH
jgi:hypothetical protein